MLRLLRHVHESEEGHAAPVGGVAIAAVGLVMLGVGAANDTGWLAIAGGIIAAVGNLAWEVLRHTTVDYDIYRRLEELEKK